MGSWSERCMITHCEVHEQTEVIVFLVRKTGYESLNAGAFARYEAASPILRGTYDDYGRVRVSDTPEAVALFKQVMGEAATLDEYNVLGSETIGEGLNLFIARADALDMLRSVRPEFVYGDSPKTCGEGEQGTRAALTEALKLLKPLPPKGSDPLDLTEWSIGGFEFDSIVRHQVGVDHGVSDRLVELMKRDPTLGPVCVDQLALLSLIGWGMRELRMEVTPQISIGPQHSGWKAIEDYANWLLATVAKERARWEDDEDEEEEDEE